MKRKRWILWTGLLLLFGILLSACSPDKEEAASVPVADLEPVEQGQTLTVVTSDPAKEKTTDEKPKYQIQTRLTDFQLLSGTTGVAWGLTRSELRMYMTDDNGKTWVNVSPASNVQFPENPKYGKDIFFMDSQTGWIVRSASGKAETIILRTTDGGASWKVASIPQKNNVASIYFDSRQHGWIMSVVEGSTGKQDKTLYRTDDGGVKWKMVMQNVVMNNQQSTINAIPQLGYSLGVVFTDSTHGYSLVQELGVPKLYRTLDGGNRWSAGPAFFNKDKLDSCSGFSPTSPQFFENEHKSEGWIPVGCNVGDSTKYNGYFTSDQGKNWTFAPFDLGWNQGLNQSVRPSFINSKEGWALIGNIIYHTVDQGKSWSPLPSSSVLSGILKDYPEVVKLQFSSKLVGWMLVERNEEMRSRLLQTTDGGITWKVL